MNKTKQNSLSELIENINVNQNNIVTILMGLQKLISGNEEIVNIQYYDNNNVLNSVDLESSSFHASELKRISNAINELSNLNPGNNTTILNESGQHYKILMTSFNKAINGDLNNIKINNNININKYSVLSNLMFPNTSISIELPNEYQLCDECIVYSFKFSDTNSFKNIFDNISYAETKNLDMMKKIIGDWYEDIYETQKRIQRYNGTFDILQIIETSNNKIKILLNNTKYSDINSLEYSRELYKGDILVNKNGTSKYEIISVDHFTNIVIIEQVAGVGILEPGLKQLNYYYEIEHEGRELRIPIQGNEKQVLFLLPVNPQTSATGEISKGFIIDTSKFIVNDANTTIPFDVYYSNNVVNIGNYLQQLISDSAIPFSKGIKPNKPELKLNDLQVLQINKHLEENSNIKKIQMLSEDKEKIYSDIINLNSQINKINSRINAGRYRSINDKIIDVQKLQSLTLEKNSKTQLYSSIINDIDSTIRDSDLNGFEPKFRVRGFFTPLLPLTSQFTRNQHIIKYKIQYRYTSPTSKTSEATTMKYTDLEGNEISMVFDSWQTQESKILNKQKLPDGKISWESNNENIINKIDIPIRPGESVEIRVAACSEAGYPATFLTSDWSDIIRVDFPPELSSYTTLSDNTRKNNTDKQKIELESIINNIGITNHIEGSFKEQDKYFAHNAHAIASGFRSNEQNTITLFDVINEMKNEISTLKNTINKSVLGASLELIDDNDMVYKIQNYQTLRLFAGAYTDNLSLTDETTFGEIISKTFYLRIKNENTISIDMYSPKPGALNKPIPSSDSEYFLPNISNNISKENQQYFGQILYQRYKDVASQDTESELYIDGDLTSTIINEIDIETKNNEIENDVYDENLIPYKLVNTPTMDWIALHKNHPLIKQWIENKKQNSDDLKKEFKRIALNFNDILKYDNLQNTYKNENNIFRNNEFLKKDKFLVGKNSCGARLFMKVSNMENIQVNGSSSNSIRILNPGDQNVILIPIVFQYRMTDAMGNINGEVDNIISNIEYRKKIGFDLIIADEKFKFDIEIFSNLRSNEIATGSNKTTMLNRIQDNWNSNDNATPNII